MISADVTYTFDLTDHTSVYAVFEELTFLAQCDPDNGGYITQNGTRVDYWYTYLDDGTVLALTPVANDGYVFKCRGTYKYNNETRQLELITYSTAETYTVTVDGQSDILYAIFEKTESNS